MKTIQEFDRNTCKVLNDAVIADLQKVCKKFQLKVNFAGGSYSPSNTIMKLKFEVLQTKSGKSGAQEEFERYANLFGMKPKHFGKSFQSNGYKYRISGIKLRGRRSNIIADREDGSGKRFRFDAQTVLQLMK